VHLYDLHLNTSTSVFNSQLELLIFCNADRVWMHKNHWMFMDVRSYIHPSVFILVSI